MTKKCLLIAIIVLLLYLNRDALNPFKPDCTTIPAGAPKPDACQVKEVAPGFEI
ncbi:hypothetical protein [Symbiopectobacterium purcellii]|uniref:Uncharacterized protein n=1 Tax=Symbiopectobacterium purcellii TaxID=2871826 RepID=A0ABX9ARZ0_9ENTR|nr:hypothetical protein [Symbiopectobacterium purcellii]QZN97541.1 hypothetical protein K6K13_09555 [Symbiopectobacterium purcellii]